MENGLFDCLVHNPMKRANEKHFKIYKDLHMVVGVYRIAEGYKKKAQWTQNSKNVCLCTYLKSTYAIQCFFIKHITLKNVLIKEI